MHTNVATRIRRFTFILALAYSLEIATPHTLQAQESFTFLAPSFTQQLVGFATLPPGEIFGGVAFAPNGDVWVDSCNRGRLFKFVQASTILVHGTTVHPEAAGSPVSTIPGCGLTNHPDGSMYMNTFMGVANIDATTGTQLRPPFGPAGNGLGMAVDPQTHYLVYVGGTGGSCFGAPTCTIVSVNPVTSASSTFATLSAADATFIDGIFFDPTGAYLFMAVRTPQMGLVILNRNGAVVQKVPMSTFPDGVAFHQSPDFVVTNNNDGTISRFEFPSNDYSLPPSQTLLASGGFRGDIAQVGPDRCLYVTQAATRFNDGTTTSANSVVRICTDFLPPPGVVPAVGSFVIGDLNAIPGNTVTFWSAKWAEENTFSAGPASSAFKGFANTVPQRCGQTWTSAPGNSSNPPDSVPQFIAVIGSGDVTKSESNISGTVSKIVIVRTNPGYGRAPGHAGTGTVVSIVCGDR
jgi:hypothetical protein